MAQSSRNPFIKIAVRFPHQPSSSFLRPSFPHLKPVAVRPPPQKPRFASLRFASNAESLALPFANNSSCVPVSTHSPLLNTTSDGLVSGDRYGHRT